MDDEIPLIPIQPATNIKAGHYYRMKRLVREATGGPVYFGVDLAKPGSDRTVYVPVPTGNSGGNDEPR